VSEYSGKSIKRLTSKAVRSLRSSNHSDAIEITGEIIQRDPDHAGAHAIQFSSLFKSNQFETARRMGGKAAELNPKSVFILNNQACLQLEAKQPAAAAGLLKSLIDQFGDRAQWLYNLALAQRMVGNFDYAIKTFHRTLSLKPDHGRAAFQLADCLKSVGHHEEAVKAFDYVRLLRSKHSPTHSNFIHHSVSNDSFTPVELKQEIDLWGERFIPKDKRYKVGQIDHTSNIKFGFLIGVIPNEWLINMVAPVINQLSQGKDSVSVYWHDERIPTNIFDKNVNLVISSGLSDADFARRVRNDKIDVMTDICGMRVGSRQRSLGLRLCSEQFGWLAHEGVYASPLITAIEEELDKQRFFISAENRPKAQRPKPLDKAFIGIGCSRGIAYDVVKSWAYILHQLDDWRLLLDVKDNHVIQFIKHQFSTVGIGNDRLVFDTKAGPTQGSIVLDNFINNEPVSAYSAIESGGVLVALKGPLFPAQHTAALLSQIGLDDWLCKSRAAYVARALTLAQTKPGELSSATDTQLNASKVRNLESFTAHFRDTITKSKA